MSGERENGSMSFWNHLDVLRTALLRILGVTLVFAVAAFFLKDWVFGIVFAPKDSGFITYRWLDSVSRLVAGSSAQRFDVPLINTGLAEQFIIHVRVSLYAGLLGASPYILYQLFRFVSPALYCHERKYAVRVVGGGYVMFWIGVLVSYFLIFPMTFRFLGTYQVSGEVENLISLQSYISTLMVVSLAMGIVFEIPILSWFFAKLGFLSASFMRRYRKYAIVIILVVAAVITPTSDIFTLLLVSFPMWALYEASIMIVRRTRAKEHRPV